MAKDAGNLGAPSRPLVIKEEIGWILPPSLRDDPDIAYRAIALSGICLFVSAVGGAILSFTDMLVPAVPAVRVWIAVSLVATFANVFALRYTCWFRTISWAAVVECFVILTLASLSLRDSPIFITPGLFVLPAFAAYLLGRWSGSAVLAVTVADIGWIAWIHSQDSAAVVLMVLIALVFNGAAIWIIDLAARGSDQRRRAEAELQIALAEAKRADFARRQFITNMTHDLKTPMNSILGFAQLIENNPKEPASPKQKEFARHILSSGRQLLDLINRVLDLSELERSDGWLELDDVDAAEIVAESVALMEGQAAGASVTLVNDVEKSALPKVRVDATRMRQIMLNLLSNGVRFNRAGGSVTVTAAPPENGRLRISVVDSGIGIPENLRHRIFDPFVHYDREHHDSGAGIGLAVCKRIVELADGEIGFKSEEGKGSTFWFELPLAEPNDGENA